MTSSVGIMLEEAEEEKLAGEVDINEVIDKVNQEDFRNYGLIPEFLGRLPIICPLKELTEDQLCQILTEPKNALVKQYKELLKYDKVDLEFDQDALKAIANKAIVTKTGARGLRSIMENLLLTTKGVCDLYLHGTLESSTPAVHDTFDGALQQSLKIQDVLYRKMSEKGWYPTEMAEQKNIEKVKQKYKTQRSDNILQSFTLTIYIPDSRVTR